MSHLDVVGLEVAGPSAVAVILKSFNPPRKIANRSFETNFLFVLVVANTLPESFSARSLRTIFYLKLGGVKIQRATRHEGIRHTSWFFLFDTNVM